LINSNLVLAGNVTSLASGSSTLDFTILKFFKINIHHPKTPNIVEVIWTPPLSGWIKCNIDGSSLGNPGVAASAGIF
jgi:hypothetical protein